MGLSMTVKSRTVHLMGTVIKVQIEHDDPEPILDEVVRRLKSYEQRFSANDRRSELMQISQKAGFEPVKVDPELYQLIKIGKQISVYQNDNLNIAIGPLVRTWRIGFNDARVPTESEINSALAKTNPNDIELDDTHQTVFLRRLGMAIDLGSLAKGYFADLIAAYLKQQDVASGLINLGGNVVVFGPNFKTTSGNWRIGIQAPGQPRGIHRLILNLQDKSIVTSGIYERHLEQAGHDYHHILDRRTGYPVKTDLASLTIISDRSIDGEIWTGRLFGLSQNVIIAKLAVMDGIDGVLINKDGSVISTLPKQATVIL